MTMRLTRIFRDFAEDEKTGGLILAIAALASIVAANSPIGEAYRGFWNYPVHMPFGGSSAHTLTGWINDGLMTLFFLLVGLEIERELYLGEFSEIRNAALPVIAAVGGMVVPSLIHFSLNAGTPARSGFGIPMATDIAFSLGVLSLLGRRVPVSLKIVLTALAIIDDLGAILVIAIFYVGEFSLPFLLGAMAVFLGLIGLNRLNVRTLSAYLAGGAVMWLFMLLSGVHATITGVLLAFAVPFRKGDRFSPSNRLERLLEKPVPLLIVPLFVLANTGIPFAAGWLSDVFDRNTAGIFFGLVLGKPLGIVSFSFLAVRAGLCSLPEGLHWRHMAGMGALGGIGFTMSIFITNLAFGQNGGIESSKMAILAASVTASLAGLGLLGIHRTRLTGRR